MIARQFLITATLLFALTIAMSVYVWQLQRRETKAPRVSEKNEHVAPPASGAMEQVTVYVASDSPPQLLAQSISIPLTAGRQQRAEGLLRGLLNFYTTKTSAHPLAAGAEIRQVFLVDPGKL